MNKWIQKANLKGGALHTALHVSQDKKIPLKKLQKAANSSNTHLSHMAQFALNVRGLAKK